MTISSYSKININGTVISFGDFSKHPTWYMNILSPYFRRTTLIQKDCESHLEFCKRIFSACYYRKGFGVHEDSIEWTQSSNTADEYDILNALGITVIKPSKKTSKIVFKNSGNQYKISNEEIDKIISSIKTGVTYKKSKKIPVKIGVELEFVGKASMFRKFGTYISNLVGANRYECKMSYNHNTGDKWILGTDSSVKRSDYSEIGYELTSPKLDPDSEKDMEELASVINLVKDILDGYVNNSCGTHIHMSYDCKVRFDDKTDLKWYLSKMYKKNENTVFDKVVPFRRKKSRWCRSCSEYTLENRYQKLNLVNDCNESTQLHLEFRQLDGTLDYNKIVAWIKLQRLFVQIANVTYKDYKKTCEIKEFTIEEAINDKCFNSDDIESLLKEGRQIQAV